MVKVTLRDKKTQYSILGMRKCICGRYSELVGEGMLLLTGGQRSLLVWLVCSWYAVIREQKMTCSTGMEQGGQKLFKLQIRCAGLTEGTEVQWEPREVKGGRLWESLPWEYGARTLDMTLSVNV